MFSDLTLATNKDKLIAGAQKLVEKGQFDKAIKEYLKVVQTDDKDVRIWLKIGDLYAKLGKKQEASETYQKVAEFYSEQGFYLKSVAVYKQILKIDPRLIEVNQRLAELYKQLGLLSDAMQQYETVAAFFHKEGKTREALSALKQIVELDPETVANRIKLAELYSKEQMPREAIDEFTKAAEQLKESGRTDDYMKVAERLLFHSPDNRPVSKELARLYIEKSDPRRALPKLQVCFKADPRDTEVLSLLAKAFESLDQRSKSVSVLKELARILGENGDRQARDEVFRKILTLAPGDPDAEAALGTGPPRKAGSAPAPLRPPPLLASSAHQTLGETGSKPLMSAGWPNQPPPPAVVQDDPPADEFDERRPSVEPAEKPAPRATKPAQPQTAVGKLLDASETGSTPQATGDGEEVARILNETDVYIKYKLYAKAIEHVQRVFEHDPRHVEAREKLKALYLSVGKRDEAVLELWALAEQAEPGRQRRFLREILELDPSHARAAAMLGEEPAAVRETTSAKRRRTEQPRGGGGENDELLDVDDLEELNDEEFDVAEPSQRIQLPIGTDADDASTLNERADALAGMAAPPNRDDAGFGEDEVSVETEEPETASDEDDLIPLVVDPAHERAAAGASTSSGSDDVEDRFGFGGEEDARGGDQDRFSLDSAESAVEPPAATIIPPAPKMPASPAKPERPARSFRGREELSEDHDVRTRFDDQAVKHMQAEALFGSSDSEIDESELPPVEALKHGTATVPSASLPRSLANAPTRTEEPQAAKPVAKPAAKAPATPATPAKPMTPAPMDTQADGRSETSLEDDLDEADFFIQQSLFDEARAILEALLERHPSHPLVGAKMRDLVAMESAAGGETGGPPPPSEVGEIGATTLDGSEPQQVIEADLSAELPDDLPGAVEDSSPRAMEPQGTEPAFEMTRKGVIEKGVTAEDFETHYDLGIAYKEMGLLDDAIAEFKLVMKDTAREVQCHLMIGLCCLEKGLQTEAIGHFKKGLYVEGISERESLSLYFELGQAYERLGDPREALYYYEKVVKRDPRFRNVEKLVEGLRSGVPAQQALPASGSNDDVDAAFDTLLGSGESS